MNKKEITIKRKRTGILFFIFIWSLLEIMVGACFVYMLIYMPSIFLILTLLFFLSGPAILIMIFVEELNKEVKICDGKIFIKYDRKKTFDSINICEYESGQRVVSNIRGDVITLRFDQKHFIRINDKEWDNYEALLIFIVNNDIKVKTNYPKEFAKVKKRILNQYKSSINSYSQQRPSEKGKKQSIRERILMIVLVCCYLFFGFYIQYLAITENEISYKTILTFTVGLLISLVGLLCPIAFRKKH
ncbi:hypothetical protein [Butyrivibrio fibrisolvens]|uniref:Uncharacterized protein n=1 Tax=Butyrivibrio fibrisolvens TaxID=831 RepID=A0A317FVM8_BUTFI|nr:hypothetical protein [Butyrivibrio fibrisolvens]PWT25764.1 hypothetical protein CPT75_01345 [Butyrivibrio fibrisolvens]